MAKKAKKQTCVLSTGIPDLSTIRATKDDIRLGKGGSPQFCALARAVRRQLGPLGKDAELSITGRDSYVEVNIDLPEPQVCVGGKLVPLGDVTGESYVSEHRLRILLDLGSADDFIERFDQYKDGDDDEYGKPVKAPKPQTFKADVEIEAR